MHIIIIIIDTSTTNISIVFICLMHAVVSNHISLSIITNNC